MVLSSKTEQSFILALYPPCCTMALLYLRLISHCPYPPATGQQAPGAEQVEFMTFAERGRGPPGEPRLLQLGPGRTGRAGAEMGGAVGLQERGLVLSGAGSGFKIGSVLRSEGRRGPGSSLKLGTKLLFLPGRAHVWAPRMCALSEFGSDPGGAVWLPQHRPVLLPRADVLRERLCSSRGRPAQLCVPSQGDQAGLWGWGCQLPSHCDVKLPGLCINLCLLKTTCLPSKAQLGSHCLFI